MGQPSAMVAAADPAANVKQSINEREMSSCYAYQHCLCGCKRRNCWAYCEDHHHRVIATQTILGMFADCYD